MVILMLVIVGNCVDVVNSFLEVMCPQIIQRRVVMRVGAAIY